MAEVILLIEDDASIRQGLELNLSVEGYQVIACSDGERGLELAREQHPSLIVLDLTLPKLDGLTVLRAVRRDDKDVPIVILSARGQEAAKVEGLSLGADDYVTKPFGLKELLARVHAALRRAGRGEEVRRFGRVEVDLKRRRCARDGAAVELSAREFDLLRHFVLHPETPLSREQIMQAVWGIDYFGTPRTVDNFILRLREKLEDDPSHPRLIETVRGVGYRFNPASK
ncbi:MAG: response regulator transcription factor [Myxococcales bacterium]